MCVFVHACVHTIIYLNHISIYKMEDNSLLDDPTTLFKETPSKLTSHLDRSFSKRLVYCLELNRKIGSETVIHNNETIIIIRMYAGYCTSHI